MWRVRNTLDTTILIKENYSKDYKQSIEKFTDDQKNRQF